MFLFLLPSHLLLQWASPPSSPPSFSPLSSLFRPRLPPSPSPFPAKRAYRKSIFCFISLFPPPSLPTAFGGGGTFRSGATQPGAGAGVDSGWRRREGGAISPFLLLFPGSAFPSLPPHLTDSRRGRRKKKNWTNGEGEKGGRNFWAAFFFPSFSSSSSSRVCVRSSSRPFPPSRPFLRRPPGYRAPPSLICTPDLPFLPFFPLFSVPRNSFFLPSGIVRSTDET